MANYHLTVKMISRQGGRSCVAALAYRSATKLVDQRTGETWDYTNKPFVGHVAILIPDKAPAWITGIAEEAKTSRQSALQKFSDICEAAEKRIDSQVYREVEFSLPNELTDEQNIAWVNEFVKDVFVKRGMVAVLNFHFDIDPKTGEEKPHCHVLLTTRDLTEEGFGFKNRDWNSKELVEEAREQYAAYQNAALKEHGFEVRVDHRSYVDQELDIDPQPKRNQSVFKMNERGIKTDKLKLFDAVRLKNQFKIVKNPELVFSIVTAQHSTFTRKDIAKVLHRYIDDTAQFRVLCDRLMASKELVNLESLGKHPDIQEPVYTTREMLRTEMSLARQAEELSAQKTHGVHAPTVEEVIAKYNQKLENFGGLSEDQKGAIRHMLKGDQFSCVVGFAGAGKTTCLEAVREAWEAEGYKVLGLAPTGKAARNIQDCGIRSLTIHKFLLAQEKGREKISDKTIVVLDEAGMVDSRRFSELLSLIDKTGAKIVPMGDGNQVQSVEAGPAFRLLLDRVKPAVLEKVVRQQVEWQRDATQFFGKEQTRKALELYQEHGCFSTIQEESPNFYNQKPLLDNFCLARQMSGHIWKEMMEDFKAEFGKEAKFDSFDFTEDRPETDFETVSQHQDFDQFKKWKKLRQDFVKQIIADYPNQRGILEDRDVNVKALDSLIAECRSYKINPKSQAFKKVETILRQMSYEHITDTREKTRESLVTAWAESRQESPQQSHIMLAFTNKDANRLNEAARIHMREQGEITGKDYIFKAQRVDEDDFGRETITVQERTFAKGDRLLFTRNSNSLNVKNGSLGTILEVNQSKLMVKLDTIGGKEGEAVAFSPSIYPFIDNGWATTIHKAQGVTVDHVKLLASYEQYRNLAYVGMSRHRYTLQIIASSLDFWREEKIIDRLSRVQEKLSGLDYLDEAKIQEKLKEDTDILWHTQKLAAAKDFWSAVKITAKDVFDKVLDRPSIDTETDKVSVEEFLSFDDSEEMRSRDFFEDSSHTKSKGAFGGEEDLSSNDLEFQNSNSEKADKLKTGFQQIQGQPSSDQQNGQSQKTSHETQSSSPSPEKFDEKLKAVQDKTNKDFASQIVLKEKFLSFKEVEEQLKERIIELATDILGKPTGKSKDTLRFGNKGSVCVFISGKKQGVYTNFETDVKGGPLKLIEDQQGFSSPKEALKWAVNWLGGNQIIVEHRTPKKPDQERQRSEWRPVFPIPKDQENPDITSKYLNIMLKDSFKESARYAYRDEQGNLKGYVVRLEKPNGDKIDKKTPPLAYCEDEKGTRGWRWQAFDTENRTPYGIEKLVQDPTKPILIVEGEKTADAAQKLLPEYHVLTWGGGTGSVDKTDWLSLVGKKVVIWPDHDYNLSGQKAAQKIQQNLTQLNSDTGVENQVTVIQLPSYLPNKWDLADRLPERWNLDTVRAMIKDVLSHKDKGINVDNAKEQGGESSSSSIITNPTKKDASSVSKNDQANPLPQNDSFCDKREAFEKSRLPFHQEWCSNLGFFVRHKRFPETDAEISAAYWQGERLTAIEGRLYKEALEGNKRKIDQKQLLLQARKEMSKNQATPEHIIVLGRASDLSEAQLQQFEQHVLIHHDKMGTLPTPTQLDALSQAIKTHSQIMGAENVTRAARDQNPTDAEAPGTPQDISQKSPDIYKILIEQQASLAHTTHKGEEVNKKISLTKNGKIATKPETPSSTLKPPEIRDSCSEKIERMNDKIQTTKEFAQDMKALELNRQNSRGMEI